MTGKLHNWAGNFSYRAARLRRPETIDQVQEIVGRARQIKALGTRHAFNDIADTPGDLISLEHLDGVPVLDTLNQTVTVGAGQRYGPLCGYLQQAGFALRNMASLPHISVAGACATATHGSGDGNGNLATAVSAFEMVRADGELVAFSRAKDGPRFQGMIIALGALGVVTRLTLQIVPAFEMRQVVYANLALEQLEEHFDEITSAAYSVSLFTRWRAPAFEQVWLKSLAGPGLPLALQPHLFGAALATRQHHPISGFPAENCTPQMGVTGPWNERLPHFRMNFMPSSGDELQTEYLVPRENAVAALRAIDAIREQVAPLLQVSEVRSVAADDLWMSPCYRQPCVAIHFTWKRDWPSVSRLLPRIETQLESLDARPHWGKLFTMAGARVKALYPRLPDFRELVRELDPHRKFQNAFLERNILA